MIKEAIKKAMFSSAWILHLIKGDISNMFVCLLLVFKVAVLRGAFVSAVFHCTGRTIMSWQMKRLLKKATCSFAWNLFKHHHAIARRRKYKSYRDIIPKSKCPFYIQIIKLNVKSSRLLLHCKEYIVQRKLWFPFTSLKWYIIYSIDIAILNFHVQLQPLGIDIQMGLRLSLSDLPGLSGNKSLVDSLLVHMLLCDVPLQLLCRGLVQEWQKGDELMMVILKWWW